MSQDLFIRQALRSSETRPGSGYETASDGIWLSFSL